MSLRTAVRVRGTLSPRRTSGECWAVAPRDTGGFEVDPEPCESARGAPAVSAGPRHAVRRGVFRITPNLRNNRRRMISAS